MKKTYGDKLKDPRWQRRRLQVLEAGEWKCRRCNENTETLHVHHRWYVKGLDPWEYEDEQLESLCAACHQVASSYQDLIGQTLSRLESLYLPQILGYVSALLAKECDFDDVKSLLLCVNGVFQDPSVSRKFALGISHVYETTVEKVIELSKLAGGSR